MSGRMKYMAAIWPFFKAHAYSILFCLTEKSVAYTNYVNKVVSSKMLPFVNVYQVENVNVHRYVGGQKRQQLVNVVCERPLTIIA